MLFYILKLRRRPVAVPFSRIWERILRDKEATTCWSRLKRLLSLLLQLALLLLLILALGDPRIAGSLIHGRSVVVLVDGSASMKATDVEPSRIEQAKTEVKKLVRGLGGSDRMLIAQMDAAITPLSTMTSENSDLEHAAEQIHATDTRADFRRALRFALDSLQGLSKPEIVVVSDGALGDPKEIMEGLDPRRDPGALRPGGQERQERRHHAVFRAALSARQVPLRGDARGHEHQRRARGRRAHAGR